MSFNTIDELRTYRNQLLIESDAWLLPDFPLAVEQDTAMTAILAYRLQLRNWPIVETDLANPTVPSKPPIFQ